MKGYSLLGGFELCPLFFIESAPFGNQLCPTQHTPWHSAGIRYRREAGDSALESHDRGRYNGPQDRASRRSEATDPVQKCNKTSGIFFLFSRQVGVLPYDVPDRPSGFILRLGVRSCPDDRVLRRGSGQHGAGGHGRQHRHALRVTAATSTSFWAISRAVLRSHPAPHAPCAILYVVPILIGC